MHERKRMNRAFRLRSSENFSQVFQKGARLRGNLCALRYLAGAPETPSQWGIAVGRKWGSAVKRNRAKRLIRECVRQRRGQLPKGYQIVVEVLPAAKAFSEAQLCANLERLFDQIEAKGFGRA